VTPTKAFTPSSSGAPRILDRTTAPRAQHCSLQEEDAMAMAKIANFDEWIDLFKVWQTDIGVDTKELKDYKFDVKLGDMDVPEIEFGHYAGQRKWPTVMHIPDQRIRDALQTLIIFQGDTEFASV
jgi:hypothetical protein